MSDRQYVDLGDGTYVGVTKEMEHAGIARPTSQNRKWITQQGLQDSGGQFKDGKRVEPQKTDI